MTHSIETVDAIVTGAIDAAAKLGATREQVAQALIAGAFASVRSSDINPEFVLEMVALSHFLARMSLGNEAWAFEVARFSATGLLEPDPRFEGRA